jgi:hypothetical protein
MGGLNKLTMTFSFFHGPGGALGGGGVRERIPDDQWSEGSRKREAVWQLSGSSFVSVGSTPLASSILRFALFRPAGSTIRFTTGTSRVGAIFHVRFTEQGRIKVL